MTYATFFTQRTMTHFISFYIPDSTTINFITEFMQTMLSKTQMSPPCCSTPIPSNRLTQAHGAQAAGQAASQHASPAAFPVASLHTNALFSSSTHFTRSSLKAVAATYPDAAATTLPDSADANSAIGGLTSTSGMPTASKNCEGLWQYFRPN